MALDKLLNAVTSCPPGRTGWRSFEDACLELLEALFVPPLQKPKIQHRSLSGIDRRDAVFPNRQFDGRGPWAQLLKELNARMVLFEFKNFDETEIGKDEVDQVRNYLTEPMGRLAVLCCNKKPNESAHARRNSIFSSQERKVILFLTPADLREMCNIKERGEDPADLIVDLVETFYLQHE